MAISDNYVPIRQIGNGVTTQFSASWAMLNSAYALVFLEDAITGVQTQLTEGGGAAQYQILITSSGFTVTYGTAPTSGQYAVIGRGTTQNQIVPYRTSKGFQGDLEEGSYDKLTAMIQDQQDAISRALTFPLGSPASGGVPSPIGQAGKLFGINATEDGIEYFTPNTAAYLNVSAYMMTVLPAVSAAAARTLLAAAPLASPTFTGLVTTQASAVGGAGFNLPPGVAPTSPNNGDLWLTAANLFARIGGATQTIADAEVGAWTPTLTFATPGNLAVTYAVRAGQYIRVGKMVTIRFDILTSAFTFTTASGVLTITGLPFATAANTPGPTCVIAFQGITKASYTQFNMSNTAGSSVMNANASGSGQVLANVNATDVPSAGTVRLIGNVTYEAA